MIADTVIFTRPLLCESGEKLVLSQVLSLTDGGAKGFAYVENIASGEVLDASTISQSKEDHGL